MSKMTSGPAAAWHPGMTTVGKADIRYMKPSQRNRYRRQGFTWAEIRKIDQAIGRGESTVTLTSATREITLTLPRQPRRSVKARQQEPTRPVLSRQSIGRHAHNRFSPTGVRRPACGPTHQGNPYLPGRGTVITTRDTSDPLKALRSLLAMLDDERLTAAWVRTEAQLQAEARRSFQAMVPMARTAAKTAPEDLASARLIVARDEALADLAAVAGALTTASRVRIRVSGDGRTSGRRTTYTCPDLVISTSRTAGEAHLAVDSLRSDRAQFLIGSRVVVGCRAAN